jgi:glutamate 5-kinase
MSDAMRFEAQPLPAWRRAVLKVGSSLLAGEGAGLSTRHALGLAGLVRSARAAGREVVVVSSGAVAAGRALLRGSERESLAGKQALAALGQANVIALWQRFFDAPVAQVLLTHDDLRNRRRFLNARATLQELLRLGAIPVVNENDTVGVDELKLGDNDNLAAMVAALVDADLLLIASDVPGLFDADPRLHANAAPVPRIERVDAAVLAMAGGAGSTHGTGGMLTKLQAAQKAAEAGIVTALFRGSDDEAVRALAGDRLHGTLCAPARSRLAARKHWIRHAPPRGRRDRRRCRCGARAAGRRRFAAAGRHRRGAGRFRPRRRGDDPRGRRCRTGARRVAVRRRRSAPPGRAPYARDRCAAGL